MVSLPRPIALVGLPGAGKTRVGKALAARLGCGFADSDDEVARHSGASVAAIFADQGEDTFRALERDSIKRLFNAGAEVIALGGGAFEDPSTRAFLLTNALVIWLDVPEQVLLERLAGDKRRPLLAGPDLAGRIHALSARRSPHYRQAHLRIGATNSAEMIEKIVARLDRGGIGTGC